MFEIISFGDDMALSKGVKEKERWERETRDREQKHAAGIMVESVVFMGFPFVANY